MKTYIFKLEINVNYVDLLLQDSFFSDIQCILEIVDFEFTAHTLLQIYFIEISPLHRLLST